MNLHIQRTKNPFSSRQIEKQEELRAKKDFSYSKVEKDLGVVEGTLFFRCRGLAGLTGGFREAGMGLGRKKKHP